MAYRRVVIEGPAGRAATTGPRPQTEDEVAFVARGVDHDRVALAVGALEEGQRQAVADLALDHPLERPGTEGRVVALAPAMRPASRR